MLGTPRLAAHSILINRENTNSQPAIEGSDAPHREPLEPGEQQNKRVEFGEGTSFASKASQIVGNYLPQFKDQTPKSQAAAANRFLKSLSPNQRRLVLLNFDDPERKQWTNLPARRDAGGIRLGHLNENQLKAACDLMATLLSEAGYEKIRLIMLADDQLLSDNQPRPGFGSEWFSIVIFGQPSETEAWGFQLDGHHLGLNLTIKGEQLTMGPSFIGTQPVSYHLAGNQIRPLRSETDLAYELVDQLSESQFRKALVSERRLQIQGGPGRDQFRPQPSGMDCGKLTEPQQATLLKLINSWVSVLPSRHAKSRLNQIKSELDRLHFSWHGSRQAGSDVSYMIQSPSLLIEFAYQDLGGNPLQHLHTQYRHLQNDYGNQFSEQ